MLVVRRLHVSIPHAPVSVRCVHGVVKRKIMRRSPALSSLFVPASNDDSSFGRCRASCRRHNAILCCTVSYNLKSKSNPPVIDAPPHTLCPLFNVWGADRVYVIRSASNVRDSIVASIPACHAGDRGSLPRRGVTTFLSAFLTVKIIFVSAL